MERDGFFSFFSETIRLNPCWAVWCQVLCQSRSAGRSLSVFAETGQPVKYNKFIRINETMEENAGFTLNSWNFNLLRMTAFPNSDAYL